jgi:hypothetical protein
LFRISAGTVIARRDELPELRSFAGRLRKSKTRWQRDAARRIAWLCKKLQAWAHQESVSALIKDLDKQWREGLGRRTAASGDATGEAP